VAAATDEVRMNRSHSVLWSLVLAVAGSGLASTGGAGCAPPDKVRVAILDGARVIQITKRGKKIRDQLQEETSRLSGQLAAGQRKIKELQAAVEELEKQTPRDQKLVDTRRREQKEAEVALQVLHTRLQEQLNRAGEKLLEEFKEKIRQVALRIKDRDGLDVIIMTSRGDALWVWPATDITDKLVQEMDAQE
jgi:Skp family chaperone for outer membrane proteins